MSKFQIDPNLTVSKELNLQTLNLEALREVIRLQHPISQKYQSLGGAGGWLGPNTTPITSCPDGVGSFQHYANGSIYYHPNTGAHEVHGLIRARWQSLGWERSFLGYPTTDETACPDGVGRFNHFQGGSIYWSPSTGAWEVHGAIRSKYSSMGWERSLLGYPLTNEMTCPDGVGKYNHFQRGSIYWSPSTGAWEVHGLIREHWKNNGWERSSLGYPISDEQAVFGGDGRISHFQRGSIYWSSTAGSRTLTERVRVHVKILTDPVNFTLNQQFAAMQEVFALAGIRVDRPTIENLNLPDLNDLDAGQCVRGSVTAEQTTLFGNRNFVGANDVVVYYVRSTVPAYNGCAAHPTGRPGCVVVRSSSRWTLAHEFGHVLGLSHVNNSDRLMTGGGTGNLTNPPPDLIASEVTTMRNSALSTVL
jgi:uncharacterized protein with LGFP repeats